MSTKTKWIPTGKPVKGHPNLTAYVKARAKAETKKLPGAQIGCVRFNDLIGSMHLTCMNSVVAHETDVVHYVLVIPMPTLKSAKDRLKIEQMTEEELVEGVAKVISQNHYDRNRFDTARAAVKQHWKCYASEARSILSFLGRSGT